MARHGDQGRLGQDIHRRFTCIQDNSVVHGDDDVVIGDKVVIGHRVLCHARRVGHRVLIGNGATVNDGVTIGEDSLLASGHGGHRQDGDPGQVAGGGRVPGRVRGQTRERHLELMERTYRGYVEKTRRYKRQDGLESTEA